MNTADRSIALMDYALRRRFAFFTFEPAFEQELFKQYVKGFNNSKFEILIKTVEEINKAISEDENLGSGYKIGHSYFCGHKEINDKVLTEIVEYELIPLIKEYWYDDSSLSEKIKKLRDSIK